MTALRLATVYPCCGGRAVLHATPAVPLERFDRRCPRCGTAWTVTRRPLAVLPTGGRFDRLDWDREHSSR